MLLGAALAFSGCSLFEKDIEAEVDGTFFVNESDQGEDIQYSDFILINATQDSDISDNLDKIKEWSVKKISYSLSGFDGDASTTFSGSVSIKALNPSSGTTSVSASVSNINLQDLSSSGEKVALSLSQTELATIAGWFDSDERVEIYAQGTLSKAPTSFNLTIYIELVVKAKVL